MGTNAHIFQTCFKRKFPLSWRFFFFFRFVSHSCIALLSQVAFSFDMLLTPSLLLHKPNAFWHNIGCWPRWFELLKITLDLRSEKSHDQCSLLIQWRRVMIADVFVFRNRNPSSCALENVLQYSEILIAFPTRFIMHLLRNKVIKMKVVLHPCRFRMDSSMKKTACRSPSFSFPPGIIPLWKIDSMKISCERHALSL